MLANTAQIREADRIQIEDRHTPSLLLMEQAGRLSAAAILRDFAEAPAFLVLAGPGNNGGDGLVIARYLQLAGKAVALLRSHPADRYQGDALVNYRILGELPVPQYQWEQTSLESVLQSLPGRPVLVDALLGTGINSALREPVAGLIAALRPLGLATVAIDLPSGLSADTGAALNEPLPAQRTLTFQLPKLCHYLWPAAGYCGQVETLDIGIWPQTVAALGIRRQLLSEAWLGQQLQPRGAADHKGTFGHLLVIGGSRPMAGAVSLTALAGVYSGAGLVTVLAPGSCRQAVYSQLPEAMVLSAGNLYAAHLTPKDLSMALEALPGKAAVVLGPGLGKHEATQEFVAELLPEIDLPLLLDADGLNLLAANPEWWDRLPAQTVLTPHPGEMGRLQPGAEVRTHRLGTAEALAREKGVTVLLKGAGTVIAAPDGRSWVNPTGNPGLGTGGTGDVLSGLIGGLLAQGHEPGQAAAMGAFVHGRAGDELAQAHGQAAVRALDLAKALRVC